MIAPTSPPMSSTGTAPSVQRARVWLRVVSVIMTMVVIMRVAMITTVVVQITVPSVCSCTGRDIATARRSRRRGAYVRERSEECPHRRAVGAVLDETGGTVGRVARVDERIRHTGNRTDLDRRDVVGEPPPVGVSGRVAADEPESIRLADGGIATLRRSRSACTGPV